ncbi:HAD-IA family hydrolase [Winogradskyella sp. A3E31]|uniref:HAD-IA family hydrolase n=1 Tax=Winogradskyella sp. A3E31 TaxID=3349637 RepID=UPI00398B7276
MINTLIFDFGDVFINLDKQGAMDNALKLFGLKFFSNDMIDINQRYETGHISSEEFIEFYETKFPQLKRAQILDAWNCILKDFPSYRLDFLKTIKNKNEYRILLLSNTNELHIDKVKETVPFFEEFRSCFDKFYLSHEINLRKPNSNIFEFVINENNLGPKACIFVDDTKENTDTASKMGFHVWNIDETKEDVINLFSTNQHLF